MKHVNLASFSTMSLCSGYGQRDLSGSLIRRPIQQQGNQSGFTLIGVMVAVAVIAIALPALLFAINTSVDGTAQLKEKAVASWVAENRITELRLRNQHNGYAPKSVSNGVDEMAGQEWFWELKPVKTPVDKFIRIEVRIWREKKEDDPLLLATGFLHAE